MAKGNSTLDPSNDVVLRNNMRDPRLRVIAVTPRKRLRTVPYHGSYPYYTQGTGDT